MGRWDVHSNTRGWIVDIAVGGLIGGILGAIVAVNVVIFSGIDSGYESSLTDVFEYSVVVGLIASLVLVAAPVLGVMLARRARARRARRNI